MNSLSGIRTQCIRHLVDSVAEQEWQRLYRLHRQDSIFKGWPERLHQFALTSEKTPSLPCHLAWVDRIHRDAARYPRDLDAGIEIARDILKWGGVERGNLGKLVHVLHGVVEYARSSVVQNNAPMNAGWTKIAALFAYKYRGAKPQVIWDSRVSLSICTRLINAAIAVRLPPEDLKTVFRRLGWVPGRGGNRPKLMVAARFWFPNRYGSWDAHFAGGAIAQEIADILNRDPERYGAPAAAFEAADIDKMGKSNCQIPRIWDVWLVACVLFMDGQ